MKNLEGKVAAITGAGSGIGRELALNLAEKGCHLALSDIADEGLQETAALLQQYGINLSTQLLDVSDKDAVFAWADAIHSEFGKINLIFNNAGVALSGTVDALSIDDYRWIMDINFWGTIYGTKAFLPYLEQSGEGHIINISSVFGLTAQPLMSGYNASKYAVRGFSESIRQDLELTNSKVSVTCVHPGGIKTNIAKAARMSSSVKKAIGMDKDDSIKEFEQSFITTAETAANTIIKAVQKNKRRILIGPDARFYDLISRAMPAGYQKVFTEAIRWRGKYKQKNTAH
ncbi:short-chain dehydrogenase [Gammaproteobacteria bacterium 45_16_T64]|nr:short-chain dehydrogenase [Gammaproteobacteria bacterium 45_16_T64]